MGRKELLTKIAGVISDTLEVDASTITEETSFDELGADSFDLLELVTAFEDEFGATLDDDSLQGIKTVSDALDAVEAARG